jgi:hypothetical protein
MELNTYIDKYRALGFICIPLSNHDKKKEGKAPLIKNWANLTLDDKIDFDENNSTSLKLGSRRDHNIGIVCGKNSGIICVDIDTCNNGLKYFEMLTKKYGSLDHIPHQFTGNGGIHYIFKYDDKYNFKSTSKCVKLISGKIIETIGIDIKNNGGQFVCYPSYNLITGKQYVWQLFPTKENIICMPEWLSSILITGYIDNKLNPIYHYPSSSQNIVNLIDNQINNEQRVVSDSTSNINDSKIIEPIHKRRTISTIDESQLFLLLELLPQKEYQEYDSWLQIGMIIFNFYEGKQDKTFDTWCKYSEKNNEPDKYNSKEICEKINSFTIDTTNNVGLYTLEKKIKNNNVYPLQNEANDNIIKIHKCSINIDDDYYWLNFDTQYRGYIFPSLNSIEKIILKDMSRVFARIEYKNTIFVKKDNKNEDMFTIIKFGQKFTDLYFSYRVDDGIKNIDFISFIKLYANRLQRFNSIVFKPNNHNLIENEFNTWIGYKAKLISNGIYDTASISSRSNPNYEIIQPILDLLKEIWCDNNEEVYQYLLTWIYILLIKPETKTNVCIFACSQQGCGKNTFTDFLNEYVIGNNLMYECQGINKLIQKHNKNMVFKKLAVCDEICSTKDEFRASFDKIKSLLTSQYLLVEPKYMDSFSIQNLLNLIIFSNHNDSIILEKDDRRYLILKLSDKHKQDIPYFENIRNMCFNELCGNTFYTYFYNSDGFNFQNININKPIMTQQKKDIINYNLPQVERFYKYIKECIQNDVNNNKYSIIDNMYKTHSLQNVQNINDCFIDEIYNEYKTWVLLIHENILSKHKFSCLTPNYIKYHKIIHNYKYYNLLHMS